MPFLIVSVWKSVPSRKVYHLHRTNFELVVYLDGSMQWFDKSNTRSPFDEKVDFRYVFENSPKEIRKKLAFHLDFFNS